jgi:hypothetical protein
MGNFTSALFGKTFLAFTAVNGIRTVLGFTPHTRSSLQRLELNGDLDKKAEPPNVLCPRTEDRLA